MSKKTIIIISISIFSILIVVGAVYFSLNSNEATPQEVSAPANNDSAFPTQNPNQNTEQNHPTKPPTDPKISIHTADNTDVLVNNFYKDTETKVFSVEQDAVIKDDPQYKIIYYTIDQSFFVFLLEGNLKTVRITAEQELLKKLGATENQVCGLRVSMMIDKDAGVNDGGMDYKLSFCPNKKPLP